MIRRMTWSVLGALALTGVLAGVTAAQTTAPPPTTTTAPPAADEAGGAYDQLSAGNRKIARALFDGQKADPASGEKPLGLDAIAARKQGGEGWGAIFQDMKSRGLVEAKSLGELVSQSSRGSRHSGVVTTASGRVLSDGHPGHGAKAPKRFDGEAATAAGRWKAGHGGDVAHGGGSGHGHAGGHGHGRGK
jgi:hypothetical protein